MWVNKRVSDQYELVDEKAWDGYLRKTLTRQEGQQCGGQQVKAAVECDLRLYGASSGGLETVYSNEC
jgi:hypothetical protein